MSKKKQKIAAAIVSAIIAGLAAFFSQMGDPIDPVVLDAIGDSVMVQIESVDIENDAYFEDTETETEVKQPYILAADGKPVSVKKGK